MKFREHKHFDLSAFASEILDYWETNSIFDKSIKEREGCPAFIFYEGPPSANGMPGIHHVMARTIKDIFCRYYTQKGYQVKRKAGWDTHGLPVELGVEKELGITKEEIGRKISVKEYNEACRKAVMKYTDVWNDLTKKIGYWVDMDDPYVTYTSKYMESVWWLFKTIYDKGLIYKGHTVQPYSPKAGSALSSHELNQPGCYKNVTDTAITVQFAVDRSTLPDVLISFENLYFLAWTTTPWTLPSNTALAVGKNISYVVVKTFNQYTFNPIEVILAEALLSKQFTGKYVEVKDPLSLLSYKSSDKKIPYYTAAEIKGEVLENISYQQILPYAQPHQNPENAFRVITADFVTIDDGTGIVHIAPTFGSDDAKAAKSANPQIPPMLVLDDAGNLVPLVDLRGKFRKELSDLAGKYVKNEYYDKDIPEHSVDVEIAIRLKKENKAFRVEKYKHSYPHCWRTDKPILYYPMNSWFISVSHIKDDLVKNNAKINWKPKSTGEGRFGNWIKNANDWNLSRSRFWGTPLPIWSTDDGKERLVVGSVAELKIHIEKAVEVGVMEEYLFKTFEPGDMSDENYDKIDLHKNIVDQIILVSPSGKPMKRDPDLMDVWFDSGSMPYAQWHYPFEHEDLLENHKLFPADFIAEGVDQTRGWFYTLHVIAGAINNTIAYKNVISNGLVLDKNGQKMSKRLGNSINPFETLEKHSPDATRWYMISNANPWDSLKFDLKGVSEVQRKFFGTLYNTYSFFSLYANIDNFNYSEKEIHQHKRQELDHWILSELNSLINAVDKSYRDYEPTKAARLISDFVQERMSNWYVRLCRRRFWKGDYTADKISAYQTLHQCLVTVAKLMAPIAPFYADLLYRDLTKPFSREGHISVHLSEFPKCDDSWIDKALERRMTKARHISSLVLSLRKKEGIKVRQPLSKIMIPVLNASQRADIEAVIDLIKAEVNVKTVELLGENSNVIIKKIKPIFKTLGPRFGQNMKHISRAIDDFDQSMIQEIEQKGEIKISVNNKMIPLSLSEVEIFSQGIEGCLVASQGDLTVALEIVITDDLKKEGLARDLVNRIQNMRKDMGLEVTDKIDVVFKKQTHIEQVIVANYDYIKSETLICNLVIKDTNDGVPMNFEDIDTRIQITKS